MCVRNVHIPELEMNISVGNDDICYCMGHVHLCVIMRIHV